MKTSKWKRSWFVLKDRVLYTYKASEDSVAVESLPVLGWNLEPLADVNIPFKSIRYKRRLYQSQKQRNKKLATNLFSLIFLSFYFLSLML